MQLNKNTGRFSMEDDRNKNITITVREVTTDDTGTYWCGAKSDDDKHSNPFFHRFSMIVGGSWHIITMTARVVVLLLVPFVFGLFFIYKRFSHSKNTRNEAAAQNIREDCDYEDGEEHVQNGNSGNATANCSTDPSGSQRYSTINFQKQCGNGEVVILKPSSSACEYSTVKNIGSVDGVTNDG
ncbi:hypothetical protein D5F01_LYC03300 [Larimichthys crocea]|uniref:Immunoglobulin V-set domain-containing protein n=1 Tax=Larimichthys crocea TaxID=215358 RepID=A0A6G0J4U4_LARCR|nr:hypothetical protein D5F01_LYC03300 [Larimichthys crocea]